MWFAEVLSLNFSHHACLKKNNICQFFISINTGCYLSVFSFLKSRPEMTVLS